jgi:hypothetical protein
MGMAKPPASVLPPQARCDKGVPPASRGGHRRPDDALRHSLSAIDPVLVESAGVIRWYALAYIAGIFLGWWYAKSLVRTRRSGDRPARR